MPYIVKEFDNPQEYENYLNKMSWVAVPSDEYLELVRHGVREGKYFVVAYHHTSKEVN